jgi:hypothetical protein
MRPTHGGCQVRTLSRQADISLRKGCLDEQHVSILNKLDYGIAVGRCVGSISHLWPGVIVNRKPHLAHLWCHLCATDPDRMVIRHVLNDRAFELTQPWSDQQP